MATEEVTEMDVAASMPAERVVRAVAKAVTISEDDIGKTTDPSEIAELHGLLLT